MYKNSHPDLGIKFRPHSQNYPPTRYRELLRTSSSRVSIYHAGSGTCFVLARSLPAPWRRRGIL